MHPKTVAPISTIAVSAALLAGLFSFNLFQNKNVEEKNFSISYEPINFTYNSVTDVAYVLGLSDKKVNENRKVSNQLDGSSSSGDSNPSGDAASSTTTRTTPAQDTTSSDSGSISTDTNPISTPTDPLADSPVAESPVLPKLSEPTESPVTDSTTSPSPSESTESPVTDSTASPNPFASSDLSPHAFIVNSLDDIEDDQSCTDTHCSLREAINAANQYGGNKKEILFDILPLAEFSPGASFSAATPTDSSVATSSLPASTSPSNTITLSSPLPPLTTDNITIGNSLDACLSDIVIDGQNLKKEESILSILSSNNVVRGLTFVNSPHAAILILGSSANDNTISGNIFGLENNGIFGKTLGNKFGIVIEEGNRNVIGGNNPNIIANSGEAGILVYGDKTSGNTITKNVIGLAKNLGFAYANKIGVVIDDSGSNMISSNVISGNENGVMISGEKTKNTKINHNILNYPKLGTVDSISESADSSLIPLTENKNADIYSQTTGLIDSDNFYSNPEKVSNMDGKSKKNTSELKNLLQVAPFCPKEKDEEVVKDLKISVPLFSFPPVYSKSTPQFSQMEMSDFVEVTDNRQIQDQPIEARVQMAPFLRIDSDTIVPITEAYVYVIELQTGKSIVKEFDVKEGLQQFIFQPDSSMSDPLTIITRTPKKDKSVYYKFRLGFRILLPEFIKPGSYDYNIKITLVP